MDLLPGHSFHREIGGHLDVELPGFPRKRSDQIGAIAREKRFIRHLDPEILIGGERMACLGENFMNRLPVDGSFVIDDDKILQLGGPLRHIVEVSRLIAQVFNRFLDFLVGDFRRLELDGKPAVIGQIKLRLDHHRRRERHRVVLGQLHILHIGNLQHAKLFFLNRLPGALPQQLAFQLFADLLFELLLHHRARRLARTIPRHFCAFSKLLNELVHGLVDFRWLHLDAKSGEAIWKRFVDDVHVWKFERGENITAHSKMQTPKMFGPRNATH